MWPIHVKHSRYGTSGTVPAGPGGLAVFQNFTSRKSAIFKCCCHLFIVEAGLLVMQDACMFCGGAKWSWRGRGDILAHVNGVQGICMRCNRSKRTRKWHCPLDTSDARFRNARETSILIPLKSTTAKVIPPLSPNPIRDHHFESPTSPFNSLRKKPKPHQKPRFDLFCLPEVLETTCDNVQNAQKGAKRRPA